MSDENLNHWKTVSREHSTIVDFLEWLEARGVRLDFDSNDAREHFKTFDSQKFQNLADEFFEVDRQGLEKERRQLLRNIQKDAADES